MTSPVIADVDRDPAELRPLARHDLEGIGQRPRLERGRQRRLDRSPGLGQALPGEPLRGLDVAIAVGGPLLRMVGRLELGDDPGQPLGDRVVDLAGHPLSFIEHARLAGLGQELGVETRVLLERDLEPGKGDAALLVLLGHLLAEDRPGADRDGLHDDDREVERPGFRASAGCRR